VPTTAPVPSVEVAGLVVHRGDRTVIDGLDATFPAGAVTALTGANGAGKSTLLDVVAGVLRPTAGRVAFLPSALRARRGAWPVPAAARPRVASVPQSVPPTTLPLTVRTTVSMGRWPHRAWWRPLGRGDRAVVDAQLERMAVADLADRPLDELSGGQRQRTLVALGLAQEAAVLLVDEPTAGVDAASTALVVAALAEQAAAGVVVVHATHDPAAVGAADRVVALG
jgi:zinc/manganese transport system ATP-binding protein